MVALGERSTPNGQELLAEFIQYGHQKPFEEIVRRYAGMVFNVCYRITKDKHEAEDATQAVFLTLALQAKRGTDIKALGPWLQQVAKRLSLDNRRSKKRRATREERHHVEQTIRRESLLDDTLPSADLDELKTILHEELQKLPAKYRLPLILHYFGGLTRDEMAAELNCKPSTLGVRIFRGREMLAGRLSSRGINISVGMLAVVMGYVVKRAISETLIRSTSYAATAMFAGHDGAGMASAHVIGLTRKAAGAMVIGKVRVAAITLMLAGTSLGAGAKALGILPKIDVQQIISNQLLRMVRPLFQPFNHALRVDAKTSAAKTTVATAAPAAQIAPIVNAVVMPVATNSAKRVAAPVTPIRTSVIVSPPIVAASPSARTPWADPLAIASRSAESTPTAVVDSSASSSSKSADDSDLTTLSASSGSGGGASGAGGSGLVGGYRSSDPLPSRASVVNSAVSFGSVFVANNLYVGSPSSSHTANTASTLANATASPASLIAIPAIGGTVTESSAGEVRGYGIVNRTGTLDVFGRVVADGQGVDRTLNFTSFTSVQTSTTNSGTPLDTAPVSSYAASSPTLSAASATTASNTTVGTSATVSPLMASAIASASSVAPTAGGAPVNRPPTDNMSAVLCGNGWYAINHGRLALPLIASTSSPTTLTWGDDPNSPALILVNSVRVTLQGDPTTAAGAAAPPTFISLLSTDRTDIPDVSQIQGVAIGMWQVNPRESDIAAANLSVCYNSFLADELGAAPSSVELWTFSNVSQTWQAVSPATYELDATDHIVSGDATDINYFAVTVDPAVGENVNDLLASHLAQFTGGSSNGTQSVPEPVALPLLLAGAGLLGRRGCRRR